MHKTSPLSSRSVEWLRSFSTWSSIFVFMVGMAVLAGWLLEIPVLKSLHPGLISMKANTAICFALSGISLWLLREEGAAVGGRRRLARGCALVVASVSLVTLLEYILGRDLGLDQLVFREAPGAVLTTYPGRMAPLSALIFLMLGPALLLLEVESRRGVRPAQSLVLAGGALSLLGVFGYIYGAFVFFGYTFAFFTPMSVPTAVAFLGLCAGMMSARPDRGLMRLVTSQGPGGAMVRRLLVAVLAVPVALDALTMAGVKVGACDALTQAALQSILVMAVFACIVYWASRSLELTDLERRRAESALRDDEEKLRKIAACAHDAIIMVDNAGKISLWNEAAERLFGYSSSEALGRDMHELITPARYREAQQEGFRHFQESGQGGVIGRTVEVSATRKDQREVLVELSLSGVLVKGQWHALGIVRDISERKKAEGERELLIKSLEGALAEVKTLSGLLPICAHCKKIRDDKGHWNQIEVYIRDRSEAEFSHGICPECTRKHYGEWLDDKGTGS